MAWDPLTVVMSYSPHHEYWNYWIPGSAQWQSLYEIRKFPIFFTSLGADN